MRNLLLNRLSHDRIWKAATAAVVFTLCLAGPAHAACCLVGIDAGRQAGTQEQSTAVQPGEPLHTIMRVHLDTSTGNISVGRPACTGANPGMYLLALHRKQSSSHTDAPDVIQRESLSLHRPPINFFRTFCYHRFSTRFIANASGTVASFMPSPTTWRGLGPASSRNKHRYPTVHLYRQSRPKPGRGTPARILHTARR